MMLTMTGQKSWAGPGTGRPRLSLTFTFQGELGPINTAVKMDSLFSAQNNLKNLKPQSFGFALQKRST